MIYHDGRYGSSDSYDLHGLEDAVARAVECLRDVLDGFDSILVTGMSGVIVGVPVSLALRKPLVILRKADDRSGHSHENGINEDELGERVCFFDDFVSGGGTRDRCTAYAESSGARITFEYLYRYNTLMERP